MSPRAAIATVFALNGLLFGSWAARVPAVKDRLVLSDGELGLALAALAAGAIIAMPLAGAFATRAGSARATRLALAASCLLAPLVPAAPGLIWLMAAGLAFGAGYATLDVAMNAHGIAVEHRLGRPILSGLHAAFSLGGLLGGGVGALGAALDLDVRIQVAAVAALTLAIGMVIVRSLGPGEHPSRAPAFAKPTGRLWALGAIAFCCLLAEGAAADWSAVHTSDHLGATAAVAALAFAGFSALMTAGRLVGDRLVARLGAVTLLRGGGLLATAGLVIAIAGTGPAAGIAGFALLGAGLSSVIPVAFRAAGSLPGTIPAAGVAAVSTVGYTGFLAGPPAVGAIAELTSLPAGLGLVAVLTASVALLAPAAAPPTGSGLAITHVASHFAG